MKKTAKEKAKELITTFYRPIFNIDCGSNVLQDSKRYEASRQCAIECVNEIINSNPHTKATPIFDAVPNELYWEEVKQEIINYDKQ